MKALVVVGVFGVLLSAGHVAAQVPVPGPEHERLGYWVGTWKVDVDNTESPLGPAGKELWTFTFEWFPGKFHLVYRSELSGSNGKTADLGLFGYDMESKSYFFDEISSNGMALLFKVTRQDGEWHWICDRKLDGKPFSIRMLVTDMSPDAWTYGADVSTDGGPWVRAQSGRATRVK